MQDRYAGDIGDFGKFGLLKSLFSEKKWRLGVVWCRFPNESHNNDGRHTDYLKNGDYKKCKLFKPLSKVEKKRTIQFLEEHVLLIISSNVIYYS